MYLPPFAALDHGDDAGGATWHGNQLLQRAVERRVGASNRRGGFGLGVLGGTAGAVTAGAAPLASSTAMDNETNSTTVLLNATHPS